MSMTLSDADFNKLVTFVHKTYGIDLSKKRQLVVGRLSHTLQSMGYQDFGPFITKLLQERKPDELEFVINKLTTNYTYFMREEEHFTFFRDVILPDLVRRNQHTRTMSIWSAGCSSGEEPYTISMYLKDYLGMSAKDWDTRILATDISQRAMEVAKTGLYDLPDNMPAEWRRKYFTPDKNSGKYRVAPIIRDNVIFQPFNLMDPIRFRTQFDVIFCRNVMIYFDQPTKDALVKRFFNASAQFGYLLVGHSETVSRDIGYTFLAPSTFQKK